MSGGFNLERGLRANLCSKCCVIRSASHNFAGRTVVFTAMQHGDTLAAVRLARALTAEQAVRVHVAQDNKQRKRRQTNHCGYSSVDSKW